jgi:elongation factor 1-alpha
MDQLKEERERGITIDIMHKDFQTAKYYFTVIDAPGHRDFVKNMITGASQADAAVLVVSTPDGIQSQTREHAYLARVLGISQLIVGLNKIDAAGYDKAKFDDTKAKVIRTSKDSRIRCKQGTIHTIFCACRRQRFKTKSDKLPWYTGPTLLESLDTLTLPKKPTDKALRLPIQDAYSISGFGTVPVGRVETGQ